MPRIAVSAEQFRLTQTGKVYGLANLSAEGLALRLIDDTEAHLFPVGALLRGTLNLKGLKLEAQLRVRHLYAGGIGCAFEDPSAELAQGLARLLSPANLGAELHAIPSSEPDTQWFHGPSGTDLLIIRAAGGGTPRQLLLTVLGRYIQWRADGGLETGSVTPLPEPEDRDAARAQEAGLVRFETLTLTPDVAPDSHKKRIAKEVVLGSNLPQDLKAWCAEVLGA